MRIFRLAKYLIQIIPDHLQNIDDIDFQSNLTQRDPEETAGERE
jgi:hypothetical protein